MRTLSWELSVCGKNGKEVIRQEQNGRVGRKQDREVIGAKLKSQ